MTSVSEKEKKYCWLPRHGKPVNGLDSIAQELIKILSYVPVYMVIIFTLMIITSSIFGSHL